MSDPIALYDQADKLKDGGMIEESAAKLREALAAPQELARLQCELLPRLGPDCDTVVGTALIALLDPGASHEE